MPLRSAWKDPLLSEFDFNLPIPADFRIDPGSVMPDD